MREPAARAVSRQRPAARCAAPGDAGLAQYYAATLLHTLGEAAAPPLPLDRGALDLSAARDWADSGLMWLTGAGVPARCRHAAPSCARGALLALRHLTDAPHRLPADGAALLAERAALLGLRGRGRSSPNGACVLYRAADGHLALNLARPSDRELLSAWLEVAPDVATPAALPALLRGRATQTLLARGRLLGLPVAVPGEESGAPPWFRLVCAGSPAAPRPTGARPLVVDLSSLWAGPLCAQLLGASGARVVKVESVQRLDGARGGEQTFFDLLNAGKDSVRLDFAGAGRDQLARLLRAADIVIEGSRPRALRQLGVDAEALVAARPGRVWIALSGHGRAAPRGDWVAFGDDAAIAAGLHGSDRDGVPHFCGDALCDPLAGLHAALAALAFWRRGRGALLDVNLREVGAHCRAFHHCAAPGTVEPHGRAANWRLRLGAARLPVRLPRARTACGQAAGAGAHTAALLAEFAA